MTKGNGLTYPVWPYGGADQVYVRILDDGTEGNLRIYLDGVEYGTLFFQQDGDQYIVSLGQYDPRQDQWVNRNDIGPIRPKPDLPDMGSRSWWGTAIAALWSTENPERDGGYTAHLLSMRDEGDEQYVVSLLIWDDAKKTWAEGLSDTYPSIGLAVRQWAAVTGDDTP